MKFITVKDLAVKMKKTREIFSKERAIVTYNGKPIAMLNPINEDNFENVVNEARLTDFKNAVIKLRKESEKRGVTNKDVEDAVREARQEKRAHKK